MPEMLAPPLPRLPFFRRLIAAGAAALLLLLAVASVSPAVHTWLHGDAHVDNDTCAVTLFASGLTLAGAALAVALPTIAWRVVAFAPRAEISVSSPRYLHPPERGPPGC